MRVGVLTNLRAGKNNKRVQRVLAFLGRQHTLLHEETLDFDRVPEVMREFAEAGVQVLVMNGGDGTLQHALTYLFGPNAPGWRPMIAPIRGGRTNMVASDLGAQRDPVKSLERLLAAAETDRLADLLSPRPVLRVALPNEGNVQCGMFFGAGALHRAVGLAHVALPEEKVGAWGAGLVTGTLLARAAIGKLSGVLVPDKLRVALDGGDDDTNEIMLAMASTIDRLFLGMRPFWGTEPAPIRTTWVASHAKRIGRTAPGILRGRPSKNATPANGYRSQNVHGFAMQLDAGVVIDGELFDPVPDRVVRVSAIENVPFLRA
jgi:diacylglycerol kinase (ATP)